jgi:hypothetical protein
MIAAMASSFILRGKQPGRREEGLERRPTYLPMGQLLCQQKPLRMKKRADDLILERNWPLQIFPFYPLVFAFLQR